MDRRVLVVFVAAVVAASAAGAIGAARADPTTAFSVRFATNANGAIVTIGNNLLTCPASQSNCAAARGGAAVDDNSFTMANLDADADASTVNSSSSTLSLPTGATVLWAGLYWGARLTAGTGGRAGTGNRATMSFRVPGAAGYQTISSTTEFGPNTSSDSAYQELADVTALVRAAGNGDYWGANVVAGTGQDRYAGWSLSVVYSAPGLPLRNLTVFDGFNVVSSGAPQTVRVAGFQAPLAGTVDTQLTMVAYEGDLSQTGDYTRLNTTQLATALSPGSNFFDSADDVNGASVTTRTPADRNMLGFDIKNLGASGAIANGATNATFTFSSNGDVYYPGVLTTAINLYAPDFTASSKTVVDLTGNDPPRPGDTLRYTVAYSNTGQDPAVRLVSTDPLPANVTYVPGSLALQSGTSATTPLSDTVGDDAGEVQNGAVRVRLGSGATAAAGGTLAVGQSSAYTFRVTLDAASGGTTVSNTAHLDYATGTTGVSATYDLAPVSVNVARLANVSLTKTLAPNPAVAGGTVTATLTVANAGPNTAAGVRVTDPAPAGLTVTGVTTSTGATCGVPVDCTLGDLAAGATATVTVTGTLAATASGQLTDVAQVTTDSVDPDLTDNVGAATVPIAQTADLQLTKTADPTSAPAGGTVTYTLTVRNAGPSEADGVIITDVALNPAQLTLTGVSSPTAGVQCPAAPTASSVQCRLASLAVGDAATVQVTGYLPAGLVQDAAVSNLGGTTAATRDPDAGNNAVNRTVTVAAPVADVGLAKTGSATAVAGGPIAYTLTATNAGPSDASGVTIVDPLPAGVTIATATPNRGSCTVTAQAVTCTAPALPGPAGPGGSGASLVVQLAGTVDPGAPPGTLANAAQVSTTSTDPNAGNDRASATTSVSASADLQVTKTSNRTTIPIGAPGIVLYTITVRNNGPSVARGVTLDDLLPSALTFNAAGGTGGTTCAAPQPAAGDDAHVRMACSLPDIAPGQTVTVNATVLTTSPTGLPADTPPLTEIATAHETTPDPSSTNDSATWTLSGTPVTDLAIAKAPVTPLVAGALATYRITVTNTDATTLSAPPTITDNLPAGLTFVPAQSSADCSAAGQTVTCASPNLLLPGAQLVENVAVSVAPALADGTTISNTAAVSTATAEASYQNNVATSTDPVTTVADVDVDDSLTVTGPGAGAYDGGGSSRTVTFTVTNHGPSVARDVEFRFALTPDADVTLPTGADPGSCAVVNQELVCTIAGADLAPGQSVPVSFRAIIAGYQAAGSFPGGATVDVATATHESTLANNRDTADVAVGAPRTDLQLTKTALTTATNADGDPAFVAGAPFSYRLVAQVGADGADAQDVTVTDTLPPGFRATSANTDQGSCQIAADGGSVTCAVGVLHGLGQSPTPQQVAITVSGVVGPDDAGEALTNSAIATSSTPDLAGDPSQVRASVTDDVVEQADLQLFKSVDAPVAFAGGSIGYTLTVVDAGPSAATDAYVDDTLPAGLTLDTANSPGCTANGQQVRCTVGTVEPNASTSIRVVATTSPLDIRPPGTPPPADPSEEHPRPITNTATVGSSASDPKPDDNTASAPSAVDVRADLAVQSSVSTTTPAAGGKLTYTITGLNNGPSSADHPVFSMTLPPGFQLDRSGDHPLGYSVSDLLECSTSSAGAPAQVTVSCRAHDVPPLFDIALPAIAVTGAVYVTIPPDTPAGDYTATGRASTPTPESDYSNNDVDQTVHVQLVSDTHVVKTLVAPNPIVAGQPVTYRLTATNDGPSMAANVVISDTIPPGMDFASAVIEDGTPCPAPDVRDQQQIVRCSVGALASGASQSALIVFDTPADYRGELCNTALVGSGSLDPESADNEQQACGDVTLALPSGVGGPAPTPPPQAAPPPVTVTTRCTSQRRFTIRLRERRSRTIRRAEVRVAGRRVAVMRRRSDGRLVATIDLRGLPRNVYRATIVARLRSGRLVHWVRSYRTCSVKLPPSNRLRDKHSL